MGGDQNDDRDNDRNDNLDARYNRDARSSGDPVSYEQPEPTGRRVPPRPDPPDTPSLPAGPGRVPSYPDDDEPAADDRFEPL